MPPTTGNKGGISDRNHISAEINDISATPAGSHCCKIVRCSSMRKHEIPAAIEKARTKRAERTELTADWVVDDRCGDTRPEMVGIDWNSGMAEPAPPHDLRARRNMPQSIRMVPKMSTQ